MLLNVIYTPILFAEDTSVIINNSDPTAFQNNLNDVSKRLNRWFITNLLSLNFRKTEIINFKARNIGTPYITFEYNNKKPKKFA